MDEGSVVGLVILLLLIVAPIVGGGLFWVLLLCDCGISWSYHLLSIGLWLSVCSHEVHHVFLGTSG